MTDEPKQKTLGSLLKALEKTKRELKKTNDTARKLDTEKSAIESSIIDEMSAMGLTQVKNEYGTISISESIFAQVEDTEEFYNHIIKTEQPWLLQKRPNLTAYRELLAQGEVVPGLKPFIRKSLTVRK